MTAVKNKEECSKVLKKFAPPVKKTGEESSVQGQDTAALNEEVYVTSEDVSSMDQAEGIDAETQNTGAKDDRKKKAGKSNVVKKPRRKRKEEVGNAKKAPDTEDKENVLEASTGEVMQPVKTPKEQCHLTDLQYEDLFQRVLQKSAQDYMEYSEKILEPIPKAEEQKMSRKTCTMSKTAEDSTRAEVSGELCSAKKMPPEMTQKKLGLAGPKPHKLSLNQRKKKEEETEEIMEGRKRTRKGQPKKIVAGYTQITDQEETEDEQEPLRDDEKAT